MDYTMSDETIIKMRHEVLDNTISIENLLNKIIAFYCGFDESNQGSAPNDRKRRFWEFFLEGGITLEYKFVLFKRLKRELDVEVPKKTWDEAIKLRKIRNDFAHSLAPKQIYQKGTIGILTKDYDIAVEEISMWEEKFKEHGELFISLQNTLESFIENNLKNAS